MAKRLGACGILGVLFGGAVWAAAPQPIVARIAGATVPPGGTAQLQIFLAAPAELVNGEIILDLDPAVFDDIIAAHVFSATGDQLGSANIQGRHVDVSFYSQTGGIGRLPNLPIMVIEVPVLVTAPRAAAVVAFHAGADLWTDLEGLTYSVTAVAGQIAVGGTLSVQNVSPGGGMLSAGTVVRIGGIGFNANTAVQVDGVSVASTRYVSNQELDITLGGGTDLTGKQVMLRNPDGATVTYYSALRSTPVTGSLTTIQPILPSQLYPAGNAGRLFAPGAPGQDVAIENPGSNPVDVLIESAPTHINTIATAITLPPGGRYIQSANALGAYAQVTAQVGIVPSAPIRMGVVNPVYNNITPGPAPVTRVSVAPAGAPGGYSPNLVLTWNWMLGSAVPASKPVTVVYDISLPFAVSATTESGGQWLSVSPAQGTTCVPPPISPVSNCPASFQVAIDPSQLAAGTYNASITVTPGGINPQPTVVPVVLHVDAQQLIYADQTTFNFEGKINLTSNSDPAPFTVTTSTQSGQNWLSVAASQNVTPAALTVSVNQGNLHESDVGMITVAGPANTLSILVPVEVPTTFSTFPASLRFVQHTGEAPPPVQQLSRFGGVRSLPYRRRPTSAVG